MIGLALVVGILGGLVWWLGGNDNGSPAAQAPAPEVKPGSTASVGSTPGSSPSPLPSGSPGAPGSPLGASPGPGSANSRQGKATTSGSGSPGSSDPAAPQDHGSTGGTSAKEPPPPAQTTATDPHTQAARSVLQSFLRGMGNGNASACDEYTIASFMRSVYGSVQGCHQEAQNFSSRYSSSTVQAMRSVEVLSGTVDGTVIRVSSASLHYPQGHMSAGPLKSEYVLGLVDRVWMVTD
jgi:predicted component of type VI protein secretion system